MAHGLVSIRSVLAPNASPLTLDGTRTYLIGEARVAVIDPGPADTRHFDAVAEEVGGGIVVSVVVTHLHPDHAEGAAELADRFGAPVRTFAAGTLAAGDRIETDTGELVVIPTPGHTPDHIALHLPTAGAVFVGDLMLGGMETALVAAPEGDLGEYLASLERVRALSPRVLYPAHGAPFDDPETAIDAYVRHRREREAQVLAALDRGADTLDAIVEAVYGAGLDPALRRMTGATTLAYLRHLEGTGRARPLGGERWARV